MPPDVVGRHSLLGKKILLIGVKAYLRRGFTLSLLSFAYTQTIVRLYSNDRSAILKR